MRTRFLVRNPLPCAIYFCIMIWRLNLTFWNPYLVTVSLSGFINYLDPRSPSRPVKIIAGHNKPITRMVKGYDDSNPTLISAGSDGRVVEWSVADAATRVVQVFKVTWNLRLNNLALFIISHGATWLKLTFCILLIFKL